MELNCGIIGKPFCGKSTLFRLLTKTPSEDVFGPVTGIAQVPDERIDRLSEIFKPKKTTYATVKYVDIPGIQDKHGERSESKILQHARNSSSLLAVINSFETDIFDLESVINEIEEIKGELLLNDAILVENRLAKVKYKRTKEEKAEFEILEKLKEHLDKELPLRVLELSEQELKSIKGFQFFTLKPIIFVINLHESLIKDADEIVNKLKNKLTLDKGSNIISLSIKIEEEITQLPKEDMELFMEDLGIKEFAINRVIRSTYELLELISFFTAGEDEVRAWTIKNGTVAKVAAGEIHSDIERGFIKAELVHYDDFMKYKDMKKVKEAGLLRLEGKEYVVKDGDIINFKFNV